MTLGRNINWKGARKFEQRLRSLRQKAPDALRDALEVEANGILRDSNENINHFRGELAQSGRVEINGFNVDIVYDAPHAVPIHEGLGPGVVFPPWDGRLKDWSEAHGLVPFLVARGIWEKGIQPPRKFLERAVQGRINGFAKRVADRAGRAL